MQRLIACRPRCAHAGVEAVELTLHRVIDHRQADYWTLSPTSTGSALRNPRSTTRGVLTTQLTGGDPRLYKVDKEPAARTRVSRRSKEKWFPWPSTKHRMRSEPIDACRSSGCNECSRSFVLLCYSAQVVPVLVGSCVRSLAPSEEAREEDVR